MITDKIAEKKIAVFIDLPNVNKSLLDEGMTLDFRKLVDRILEEGNIVAGKCYMEMQIGGGGRSIDGFLNMLYSLNIDPIYAPHVDSKSLSDPMMITDAMECLYEKNFIDMFVLVTCDKDFAPLIKKITGKDKECTVMGIAKKTSPFLIQHAGIMGGHFEEVTNNFAMNRVRVTAVR